VLQFEQQMKTLDARSGHPGNCATMPNGTRPHACPSAKKNAPRGRSPQEAMEFSRSTLDQIVSCTRPATAAQRRGKWRGVNSFARRRNYSHGAMRRAIRQLRMKAMKTGDDRQRAEKFAEEVFDL